MDGIYLSLTNGEQLKTISSKDRDTLERLVSKLRQYPNDELYKFSTVSEEDQGNFEMLQQKLRNAQLGLNITMMNDWDSFISKTRVLEESIEIPLDR